MRVSIGDANAGVRGKVPLIQRRSTGERVSAVPMMMSSTSGAGYASTARGSRLAGAGGALAATGLLLAALWIGLAVREHVRSEEHTSELQSLMRISYAVFCLKKKKKTAIRNNTPFCATHTTCTG